MSEAVLTVAEDGWILPALDEALAESGLFARRRSSAGDEWSSTGARIAYLPVDYSADMIDYQLSYWCGNKRPTVDISLILIHDNRPCALWPLSLSREQDGSWRLGANGAALLPPLFVATLMPTTIKSITAKCQSFVAGLCSALAQDLLESAESFTGAEGLGDWHDRAMRAGATCTLQHEMYVDLAPDLARIKSVFRKSYKSLVISGARLWQVFVLDGEGNDVWEEYRLLHLGVAGRATRSFESWEWQYRAICGGRAFLVYLRDASGKMVGGGLFHTTKDEALYAVGVYDRTLFDKPLGHVVQFRAIEEMKARGLRWYKLGARAYPTDEPAPNAKDLAISDFKQGFSSHLLPRYVIRHRLPETERATTHP